MTIIVPSLGGQEMSGTVAAPESSCVLTRALAVSLALLSWLSTTLLMWSWSGWISMRRYSMTRTRCLQAWMAGELAI